jgi:hypothetical protein
MADIPINMEIIRNPVNWVIVILMIAIALIAIPLLFPSSKTEKK